MKVKQWVDGNLILDGDLLQGAEEAFQESRYIEAFSILQASIDAFMIFIYQMLEGRACGKLQTFIMRRNTLFQSCEITCVTR